jgi:hypothetical protein
MIDICCQKINYRHIQLPSSEIKDVSNPKGRWDTRTFKTETSARCHSLGEQCIMGILPENQNMWAWYQCSTSRSCQLPSCRSGRVLT